MRLNAVELLTELATLNREQAGKRVRELQAADPPIDVDPPAPDWLRSNSLEENCLAILLTRDQKKIPVSFYQKVLPLFRQPKYAKLASSIRVIALLREANEDKQKQSQQQAVTILRKQPPIILNFNGLPLRWVDFKNLDLSWGNFFNCSLSYSEFSGSNMNHSILDYSNVRSTWMEKTTFVHASLRCLRKFDGESYCLWSDNDFSYANLSGNTFDNTSMFNKATLFYTKFEGDQSRFKKILFLKKDLTGVSFKGCRLYDIVFFEADLSQADFSSAKGKNINFTNVIKTNANFSEYKKERLTRDDYQKTNVQQQLMNRAETIHELITAIQEILSYTNLWGQQHSNAEAMIMQLIDKTHPQISEKDDEFLSDFLDWDKTLFFQSAPNRVLYDALKHANTVRIKGMHRR